MWASLHGHSMFSLLDGLSKPEQIIKRCINVGIPAVALTDHGSMSGCVEFFKAKKKAIASLKRENLEADTLAKKIEAVNNLKLILGNEFYIADSEKVNSHLVVLAKNKDGFKSLIKATSDASKAENFYRKPRLSLDQFDKYTNGNLITFSGHMGSALANILYLDIKTAYKARTVDEARTLLDPDYESKAVALFDQYQQIFGKDNVYAEIQRIDIENLPAALVTSEVLRKLSKKYGWKRVATADSHYPESWQCHDQRVVLCTGLGVTLPSINRQLAQDDDDVGMGGFFKSSKYYIPSPEEMAELHDEEELANSLTIASECEEYTITAKPVIPQFDCPKKFTQDEYLRYLCRVGWKEKISNKIPFEEQSIYVDRVKEELGVLQDAGLSGYFLILYDIVNHIKNSGYITGPGRGSSAGCLVSYLLNITGINPVGYYDLLFSRFYNSGRNTKDNIKLPDIDLDVQTNCRDLTIDYIKNKYGHNQVGQICTFTRMMGRSVVKDVLRAHEACNFDITNKITSYIPDEAAIADELQEVLDEGGDPSIVLWALRNNKKELSEWVSLTDDGDIVGEYAKYFKQAIRLEGTYRAIGKHAAGIILSPNALDETFPLIYDRATNEPVIGVDLSSAEDMGGVKFDILGVRALDCIKESENILRGLDNG